MLMETVWSVPLTAEIRGREQASLIGWMGWSWKGNGGGVEYLDLSYDWEGTQLSPDWGEKVVNGPKGIKATSKTCSVFA